MVSLVGVGVGFMSFVAQVCLVGLGWGSLFVLFLFIGCGWRVFRVRFLVSLFEIVVVQIG